MRVEFSKMQKRAWNLSHEAVWHTIYQRGFSEEELRLDDNFPDQDMTGRQVAWWINNDPWNCPERDLSVSAINATLSVCKKKLHRNARKAHRAEAKIGKELHGDAFERMEPDRAADLMVAVTDKMQAKLAQTARDCGVPSAVAQAVNTRLRTKFGAFREGMENIQNKEITLLFDDFIRRALNSITDEDIEDAPMKDRMTAVAIAFDKRQILRGEPTQIVSIAEMEHVDKLAQALLKESQRRGIVYDINAEGGVKPFDLPEGTI